MENYVNNFCVSTVVTADHFQHYLPLFIYALKKHYPEIWVRCFIRGRIDDITREALDYMHDKKLYFDMPIEDYALEYPYHISTTNALRFLIPERYFNRVEYVYFTDVDIIYLTHAPPIDLHYINACTVWGECYWGRRGPKRDKAKENITKRIAGGGFLATHEWFEKTKIDRQSMRELLMSGDFGGVREDDEMMLWKICARAGLKCPTKKHNKRRKKYKEIHLGDFKFDHRWTNEKRMKRKINKGNYYKWHRLEDDKVWQGLTKICSQDKEIKQVLSNVRLYMNDRKIKFEN